MEERTFHRFLNLLIILLVVATAVGLCYSKLEEKALKAHGFIVNETENKKSSAIDNK